MKGSPLLAALLAVAACLSPFAGRAASPLDDLLAQVRRDSAESAQSNAEREQRFSAQALG